MEHTVNDEIRKQEAAELAAEAAERAAKHTSTPYERKML